MVMVGVITWWAVQSSCMPRFAPKSETLSRAQIPRNQDLAIISGDHDVPTRKLAESLGMDRYFAQVLPADKADYVEKLQKEGKKVCFVGDGINDSIALKKANVSISLRGASSIATDTAHIVFMEQGLSKLCDLRDIARDLDRNVKRKLDHDSRTQHCMYRRCLYNGVRNHGLGSHQQCLGDRCPGQRHAALAKNCPDRGRKSTNKR